MWDIRRTGRRRTLGRSVSTLVVCVLLATVGRGAEATTVRALSIEDLTDRSDRVLLGTVVEQSAELEGGVIWTTSVVEVDACWAGACEAEVVVRTPGGVVSEVEQRITGMTVMEPGDQLVLFLAPDEPGAFRPVGMAQGALEVVDVGQGSLALRDLTGLVLLDEAQRPTHGAEHSLLVPLDELRAAVESANDNIERGRQER